MRCPNRKVNLASSIVGALLLLCRTPDGLAQLRPIADDTLGEERSVVVPLNSDSSTVRIEGGARRGNNLFHSFEVFSIGQDRSAYFLDPGVENILARVTRGNESQILGVLGASGDANLFLINPYGIVFGDHSSLDVGGSFTATTADAVQFGEQGEFSTGNPSVPASLTIQPSAFLFNQLSPAPIVNNAIISLPDSPGTPADGGLRVNDGRGLTFLGGNIRLSQAGLSASGGQVNIGGLSQPGRVELSADGSLDFSDGAVRADVFVTDGSLIDVLDTTVSGGRIAINARSLEIISSDITAGTAVGSRFTEGQAGDIVIDTNNIQATDALIDNSVLGLEGNSGNIRIENRDRIAFNDSNVFNTVGAPSIETVTVGNGGNIEIATDTLALTNNSDLVASTFGRGNAGSISVDASSRVALNDNSDIFSDVGTPSSETVAVGNGGNIEITTDTLTLTNSSNLDASTFGSGNAGNINLAANAIRLADQSLIATEANRGDGGNITLQSASLLLLRSGSLISATAGTEETGGDGGNISITADLIVAAPDENSDIRANAFSGSGGSVQINAQSLTGIAGALQDNPLTSEITASSALGAPGTIDIATPDLNPGSGLTELPAIFEDVSNQITRTCFDSNEENNEFIITGRGGLPASPIEPLVGELPLDNWAVLDKPAQPASRHLPSHHLPHHLRSHEPSATFAIAEAQGWIKGSDGVIELVAAAYVEGVPATTDCQSISAPN